MRSLKIIRPVLNPEPLSAWVSSLELRDRQIVRKVEPRHWHVTVANSLKPMDWRLVSARQDTITLAPDTRRAVAHLFGNTLVLLLASAELTIRNLEIRGAGGSWERGAYHPHITLAYGRKLDPQAYDAFQSELHLGPEAFTEAPPHHAT